MCALNKPVAARFPPCSALLLLLALASVARAEESDPATRVARLAQVLGQVSIEPAGLDDWAAAEVNRPLTSGDKLWSDADSRAELGIGSVVIRLASATGFSFLNLDDHTVQMQVSAGTISVHVRSMEPDETLEVDTPNIAVALLAPGDYRIEVNDAGDGSVVKVSGGVAEVSGGGQDFPIHLQQQMTFSGTINLSAVAAALGAPDEFDAWAFERDRHVQLTQATSYVSADVVGAEDLDQNGTWLATPDAGYVWAPNAVPPGWAPYQDGHWIWISPWGWTWVDAARWGFAPFHYGRWASFGGRWCWSPGPLRVRPVYAPALVVWLDGAPLRASAAFGGGAGVAWFPLGPREVYVPAYSASSSYVRSINTSNTSVNTAYITSVYNRGVRNIRYVNQNAPGAITAISQTTFTAALPAGRNAVHLQPNQLAAAMPSITTPAITPAKQSLLGAAAMAVAVHRPNLAVQNRLVLVRTTPPHAPVPFLAEQAAMRANGGRPLARSELAALTIGAPVVRGGTSAAAIGAQARSGMLRASQIPATPALQPTEPRPASVQRTAAAVAATQPLALEPPVPASEVRESARRDRPPGAVGQPGKEERGHGNDVPRSLDVRAPAAPESNHRVERLTPAVPAQAPGPPPAVAAATPQAVPAVATPPKTKDAAHAQPTAHPAARVNN
jgi:hypothetical protein